MREKYPHRSREKKKYTYIRPEMKLHKCTSDSSSRVILPIVKVSYNNIVVSIKKYKRTKKKCVLAHRKRRSGISAGFFFLFCVLSIRIELYNQQTMIENDRGMSAKEEIRKI